MTTPPARRGTEMRAWLAPVALTALAALLRVWHMGTWSFEADEVYTLQDSVVLDPSNPRPLMYLLNHYLVLPFAPPSEMSLRLLPVVFGIVSVPVLYLMVRRTINPRTAFFAALLLTLSPIHIARAQYARYWTLVFVLATCAPLAVYLAVYERRWRWLAVSVGAGIAASLAHPSASLLAGGIIVWLAFIAWEEPRGREVLARWPVQLTLAFLLLAGVIIVAVRFVPLLSWWITTPQRALRGPMLLLSYVDGLTAALAITGLAGLLWLWYDGSQSLAVLLAACLAVPAVFLFLVSLVGAVLTAYLFATAPMYFIGAGYFLDRLVALPVAPRIRRLVVGSYLLCVLAAAAPLFISHYRDGGRADCRAAAAYLRGAMAPGDRVLTDEIPVLRHYLPGAAADTLKRDATALAAKAADLARRQPGGTLWVVALTSGRGWLDTWKLGLGPLAEQLHTECQLAREIAVERLDYRRNAIQIFRCPSRSP